MTPAVPDPTVEALAEALHVEHAKEFAFLRGDHWSDPVAATECGNCQRWGRYAGVVVAAEVERAVEEERALRRGFYEEGFEDGKRETVDYLTDEAEIRLEKVRVFVVTWEDGEMPSDCVGVVVPASTEVLIGPQIEFSEGSA